MSRVQHLHSRRWPVRAGSAILASAFAHALAAVTVGVVLHATSRAQAPQPELVEIDLAPPPSVVDEAPAGPTPAPGARRALAAPHVARARAAPALQGRPAVADDAPAPAVFVMRAGTIAPTPSLASGAASSASPSREGGVVGEGDVSVPARLISSTTLVYPPAARQAEIEIDLPVEIVVGTDGHVVSARALRHAGYGLDEAALRAIRAYRFSPALRAGAPVPVRMRWTIQFRLG